MMKNSQKGSTVGGISVLATEGARECEFGRCTAVTLPRLSSSDVQLLVQALFAVAAGLERARHASSVSRHIQPLQDSGYVRMVVDPDDRRSYFVAVTASQRNLSADADRSAAFRQFCRGLGRRGRAHPQRAAAATETVSGFRRLSGPAASANTTVRAVMAAIRGELRADSAEHERMLLRLT